MPVTNQRASGGLGFCGALLLLFIALKLTNQIDWSWWWVLSPFWLPVTLGLTLLLVAWGLGAFEK